MHIFPGQQTGNSALETAGSAKPGRQLKLLALAEVVAHNLTEIRLSIPLHAAAQQRGWALRLKAYQHCTLADWLWADIVVMERATGMELLQRMLWLRQRGTPVVYEIDDLLTEPADHLLGASHLRQQAENVREIMRQATAISCTTPRLAQCLSQIGPPVHLVPNYGPGELSIRARHQSQGLLTVLVAASDRQQVAPLARGLKRLVASRPGQIVVVGIGPVAACLQEHDLHVLTLPIMPRADFLRTIAGFPNPVGAIPMDDSPFSNCKSAVKYFDYTAAGIPCACSSVPPYADVVMAGRTGLLCDNDPDAWHDVLERLCASPVLRRQLNEAAHEDVARRFNLDHTIAAWTALIEQLHASAPAHRNVPRSLREMAELLKLKFGTALKRLRGRRRRRG